MPWIEHGPFCMLSRCSNALQQAFTPPMKIQLYDSLHKRKNAIVDNYINKVPWMYLGICLPTAVWVLG